MVQPIGNQNGLNVKSNTALTPEQKKLQEACTGFETMLVKKMLESMMGNTRVFGSGFSGDFYQSMFQDTIAGMIAKQGLGVSKVLLQQLAQTEGKPVK